jgi:hypothetical protein
VERQGISETSIAYACKDLASAGLALTQETLSNIPLGFRQVKKLLLNMKSIFSLLENI